MRDRMVLLRAIIRIVCPKTGKEVKLHEDCQDADKHGTPCQHYLHFGIEGHTIYVACASIKAGDSETQAREDFEKIQPDFGSSEEDSSEVWEEVDR